MKFMEEKLQNILNRGIVGKKFYDLKNGLTYLLYHVSISKDIFTGKEVIYFSMIRPEHNLIISRVENFDFFLNNFRAK
ncbi:MAG: hypothetical protein RLZ33_1553 [Bacteroidota bacterium]